MLLKFEFHLFNEAIRLSWRDWSRAGPFPFGGFRLMSQVKQIHWFRNHMLRCVWHIYFLQRLLIIDQKSYIDTICHCLYRPRINPEFQRLCNRIIAEIAIQLPWIKWMFWYINFCIAGFLCLNRGRAEILSLCWRHEVNIGKLLKNIVFRCLRHLNILQCHLIINKLPYIYLVRTRLDIDRRYSEL